MVLESQHNTKLGMSCTFCIQFTLVSDIVIFFPLLSNLIPEF